MIRLCRRNVPIAEIRPLEPARTDRRPVGLAKGRFEVPPEFFEPLPEFLSSVSTWEIAVKHAMGRLPFPEP